MKIKVKKLLPEQKWNKDSNTPRDYSKEYNPPGSKEQDERNKRKRDKRKHDKEHGECAEDQELHHVDGIESERLQCEPVSKNRGRKEKSRLKDSKIIIKIVKSLGESAIDTERPSIDGGGTPVPLDQQGFTKVAKAKRTKSKSLDDLATYMNDPENPEDTGHRSLRAEEKTGGCSKKNMGFS